MNETITNIISLFKLVKDDAERASFSIGSICLFAISTSIFIEVFMRIFRFFLFFAILHTSLQALGQDCNAPISLCNQVPTNQSNASGDTISNLPANSCFTSENSIFFSFTTIDTSLVDGQEFSPLSEVNITIENINCAGDSSYGMAISAAVFQASDLCDALTYNSIGNCADSIVSDFSFTTNNLQPANTYYIIIDGDNDGINVTNAAECAFDITVAGAAVEYNLNATPAIQSVIPGEEAILNSTVGFSNYVWTGEALSSDNTANTSATPTVIDESYTYTVQAELNGCTYEDQATVRVVPPITIYNTFTPNGDGANDTWYMQYIDRYPDCNVKVFSRWGQPVFASTGYKNNWDGDGLPAATYYYVIELNPINNQTPPITGNVTIIY